MEGQEKIKAASTAEKQNEKPKLSPEDAEAVKNLTDRLKLDLSDSKQALEMLASSPDKLKDLKITFFKSFIDQLELKLALSPEKKLAITKMEKLMADNRVMLRPDMDRNWIKMQNGITGQDFRIDEDPISVSEDGSIWAGTLELDQSKQDQQVEILKQIPEDILFKTCFVNGGKMLESVPQKVGKLLLRPKGMGTKEAAIEYANQIKAFLGSEREIDEFASTGERPEASSYGFFTNEFRTSLNELPAYAVKLKVGHDQNGYPKGRAFSTDTGNMPLAGYLHRAFPKEVK